MPTASFSDVAGAKRILLYGATGSGKSTAAQQIGDALGLPVHFVDDEVGWLPNWNFRPDDAQIRIVDELVRGDRWVLDSAYGKWRDRVLAHADVVIALDYPRWISLTRLLKRTRQRAFKRELVCNGNVETWGRVFSKDSIIRWHFHSFESKRSRIEQMETAHDGPPVLRLRSLRDYGMLMRELGR